MVGTSLQYTQSKDGTRIAYRVTGTGTPLVLVHGTGDSHTRWSGVSAALGRSHRLYAMDRRGHGKSQDAQDHDLRREIADVLAVVEAAGEPVYLMGHSYGGICALEAALLAQGVRKLILYEPPIFVPGVEMHDTGYEARVAALEKAGDWEGIWVSFLRDVIRMSDHEIQTMKASPSWKVRVRMAPVLPRELRACEAYRFDASRFAAFTVPTLLLTGGESTPALRAAVVMLHEHLPRSTVTAFPGERHSAMSTAPSAFVRAVTDFLNGSSHNA